jgi:hypothetical protein
VFLHLSNVDVVRVFFFMLIYVSDDDMVEECDSDFETSKTATKVFDMLLLKIQRSV